MAFTSGEQAILEVILAVIIGTLAAIVYTQRVLVLIERRIARVDGNIEKLVKAVLKEELKIEHKEDLIAKRLQKK